MRTQKRFGGADALRATACLMVVFHHLAQRIDYSSVRPGLRWLEHFELSGAYGVDVFFVLSGFLLARPFWVALDENRSMPSIKTYASRRLARIAPGFWLVATTSFLLSFTLFNSQLDFLLVARYIAGLFFVADWHWMSLFPVDLNGPLWSISFEVSSYLFLPIGFLLLFSSFGRSLSPMGKRIAWLAVITITLLIHTLVIEWLGLGRTVNMPEEGFTQLRLAELWSPQYNPFGFFAIFAIGALAAGIQVSIDHIKSLWCDSLFVACLCMTIYFLWTNIDSTFDGVLHLPYKMYPLLPILIGSMLALGPSTVRVAEALEPRPVTYIATLSYGIYLWHMLFLVILTKYIYPDFVRPIRTDDPATILIASAIVLVTSFAVAAASWKYLEQPILKWAKSKETTPTGKETPVPNIS